MFTLARLVRNKPIKGILAPKPPYSDGHDEKYVFDFVGMLGLPLVPTARIDPEANAAFFSVHALGDPGFPAKLKKMLDAQKPVLIKLTREELEPIRNRLLAPFGITSDAPNRVALYLVGEDCLIVENFNDEPINATLELSDVVEAQKVLVLPLEGNVDFSCNGRRLQFRGITPRTMVAVEYQ